MGNFNEGQHPRVPAGSPAGGRFTSGGEGYVIEGRVGFQAKADLDSHLANLGKLYLKRHLTKENVARIAGAPPGASVLIEDSGSSGHKLTVTVRTNQYWSQRVIDLKARTVYNEESKVYDDSQGKGMGTRNLVRQVTEARALGFHRIETYAAGRGRGEKGRGKEGVYNGYYSWARMGFMRFIPNSEHIPSQMVEDRHGNSLNLLRLMSTKTGRDYWKDHGKSFPAAFDVRPTSISSRVLDAYAKATGIL